MVQYDQYGEVTDIKPMTKEIFPMETSDEDLIEFQSFGLNLLKENDNLKAANNA